MFNSFKDKAKAIADLSAKKAGAAASSSSSKLQELFDQNYPKIEPIIVNGLLKIGEEKLKDDKLLNTIFEKGYEILPFPVRLIISRARFLEFTMTHRDSLLQKVMTLKDQRNEKLSEKEISGQNAFTEQTENDIMQSKIDSIPDSVSYLFSLPTSEEELATGEIADIPFCMNHAISLNNSGNHKRAVVWFNKALSMNPTFEFAIGLHRNRTIAIGDEYNISNGKSTRNLDFCIAMESILRDYEAIIGLYTQNEANIKAEDDYDFFDNSFEMALRNFIPIGSSNMAYQENGVFHKYTCRISQVWKISFVGANDALCVNGKLYPQYVLLK
ncbi:MAG: hypothetical protein WCO28_12085 [Bacteroidota bacterium]